MTVELGSDGVATLKITELDMYKTLRWLNRQPKGINDQLKDEAQSIGTWLKQNLTISAQRGSAPPQAPLVAKSIKVQRDRIVKVKIGGKKIVGRAYLSRGKEQNVGGKGRAARWIPDAGVGLGVRRKKRAMAGQLLWGSEYGAAEGNGIERFSRRHNPKGYWINPMMRAAKPMARRRYQQALAAAVRKAQRLGTTGVTM